MSIVMDINFLAKPYDIILLGSNDIIGRLIRYAQKLQTMDGKPSLWSHCAMWVDYETIVESTIDFEVFEETRSRFDNGIKYNQICRIDRYCNVALIQYNIPLYLREVIARRVKRLYNERKTYPILGLLGSLLSYWIFRWRSNPLQTKKSLYCSAFVQEAYSAIQIDFDTYYTSRNTSPELIYKHALSNANVIHLRRGGENTFELRRL